MVEVIIIAACALAFVIWAFSGKSDFTPPLTSKASESVLRSYQAVPSLFVNPPEAALF